MKDLNTVKAVAFYKIFLRTRTRKNFSVSFLVFALFLIVFLISGYYSAFKTISYLPKDTKAINESSASTINQIEISNPWYILSVDPEGRIAVKTLKNESIMSGLRYYAEYEGEDGNWGLRNVVVHNPNDSTIVISGNNFKHVNVNLILTVHKNLPGLEVHINSQYNSEAIVSREALVAAFDVPVSEVYRKNRKSDTGNFEPEYWLNNEGARFGTNERSALVYHTPDVSSLQLETEKNMLFVNLDYYPDHPYAKMPFLKNGGGNLSGVGFMIDLSKAKYTQGMERENSFSINFGKLPKITPRLMPVPYGYQAAYVFTEHADGGDIRTQRAAYFGSEDISKASDAVGGFVGHKIPVTKSVFYADSSDDPPGSAIFEKQNDSLLINFLDQIYATGMYDICLHTPENLNSNRKVLEESIKFMKNRYNTITWIDHGFYGGKINREALVADGLDSGSVFYAADLWEKYSTLYFWSSAVEFIRESAHISVISKIKHLKLYNAYVSLWKYYLSPRELRKMTPFHAFKELIRRYKNILELNSLMPHLGDSYPTPLYWQNPTRTNNFYSWATDFSQVYNDLSPEKVKTEQIKLDNLVDDWGIFISHGYYVRIDDTKFLMNDSKGKLIINPYADQILGSIAQNRNEGKLYATNVRDLLDYWRKIENISFEYLADGSINIKNKNPEPIKGLSIVLKSSNAKINGKVSSMRKVGEDTIYWFDINGNETMHLLIN